MRHTLNLTIFICFFLNFTVYSGSKELNGTVVPIMKNTVTIGGNGAYRGDIIHVARQGAIVFPAVFDEKDNVIEAKDVLVKLKPQYWKGEVLQAEGKVKGLKSSLYAAKQNYLRYKKLAKGQSISIQAYQIMLDKYVDNIYALRQAEADLEQQRIVANEYTIYPPYLAWIDKVLIPDGMCSTIPSVVTISLLDPIWVEVAMDRKEARKISPSSRVKIYPMNSKQPVGIIHGFGMLSDKGYKFAVQNPLLNKDYIDYNGERVPYIRNYYHVFRFMPKIYGDYLSVPDKAIYKDKQGTYVFSTYKGIDLSSKSSLPYLVKVKKCYIKPGKTTQQKFGNILYRILLEPGSLKKGNLLIGGFPDLRDGQEVYLGTTKLLFMPNDRVKVVIEGGE